MAPADTRAENATAQRKADQAPAGAPGTPGGAAGGTPTTAAGTPVAARGTPVARAEARRRDRPGHRAQPAPPDNDVLWARGLHHAHRGSPALQGVSLGVRQGEILTVAGPRGSGKTTLLRCLSAQLAPQRGEVWFNSVPVHTLSAEARERLRRERFGWVGSTPELVPELTVWENAALPLLLVGTGHRAARQAAMEWLTRLDVGDCAGRRPAALCQAQRQRVAIARALVHGPDVLFADEPTAPLHRAEAAQVLRTLTTAGRSHGITVVLASHDSEAATLADRTLTIVDGRTSGAPVGSGCSLSV